MKRNCLFERGKKGLPFLTGYINIQMKKNDKLHIPISTEGKEELKARAKECEMTLSSYCLYILTKTKANINIEYTK